MLGWGSDRLVAATLVAMVSGCTDMGEPPGRDGAESCVPLTYKEIRQRCYETFTACLDTRIQSIRSGTAKHSMCDVCRDVCMRKNGAWPASVDGRPCVP